MRNTDILIELLKHMEWADSIVWKTVMNCSNAEGDKNIKGVLVHYHTVQRVYLQMWKEMHPGPSGQFKLNDLNSTLRWVVDYYKELNEFCTELDKYDLDKNVIVPWAEKIREILGKPPANVTITDTVLHVAIHSSHHRGQVNRRVREIGGEPGTIDFIAWGWMGKPNAIWKDIM